MYIYTHLYVHLYVHLYIHLYTCHGRNWDTLHQFSTAHLIDFHFYGLLFINFLFISCFLVGFDISYIYYILYIFDISYIVDISYLFDIIYIWYNIFMFKEVLNSLLNKSLVDHRLQITNTNVVAIKHFIIRKNISENISKNICKNISKNICKNISKNICKNISKNICKNISKNICKNISKNICKNISTTNKYSCS